MKALLVALLIGAIVFGVAKPLGLRFSSESDYCRRRNVWLILTLAAIVSPNFWFFLVVAVPLITWAGSKDSNPVALYMLLLHVVPSIPVDIPLPGVNSFFPLDNYRVLAFCVLIPTALKLRKSATGIQSVKPRLVDALLIGYGTMQIAIFIPPDLPSHIILHDSPTNVLRRAFLFVIDTYVLYFVVSRSCNTRRAIVEVLAAYCLATAAMACIAFFEFSKHWLLYAELSVRWSNNPLTGFYLMRGDTLRAQAAAGHPLALGSLLAIGFGFWLYLKSRIESKKARIGGVLVFWLGLLAAYSRGPWLGAMLIYLTYSAIGQKDATKLLKAAIVSGFTLIGALASPFGSKIASVIPFMGGSVDSGSTGYRERLAQRSWELILENPIFGNSLAYKQMEDMRQGQGIIDLVNTYAEIALFYGVVGVVLFVGFLVAGFLSALWQTRKHLKVDADLAALGGALVACTLGTLLMLSSNSFSLGPEKMYFVLGGLLVAYARIRPPRETNECANSS